ncbi:C45 family autoproteolytic acyltransferase/hydolase [Vibrio metoecus]|uniref:C45 family autoproteolytic acyltransferase/hydolase n=1 Tax=Vibrio metoecus TaxID=1481663 RepID=UPI00215B9263|nr:C45 family peptidase [Vibrio metoecus]MCR9387279.1 C45 family peptidase [Vibrio metoecus]
MTSIIPLSGSDFEIGLQHGTQCHQQIQCSLTNYKAMFQELAGLSWEKVLHRAEHEAPRLKQLDPSAFEEMSGIAEGAKVSLLEILALNIRSELLFAMTGEATSCHDGCTSFASAPHSNKDNAMILGQNWDWIEAQRDACFIAHVKPESGPHYCMVTEAGIIGKIGFNTAGIGVCFNALSCGFNPSGWPAHLLLRKILRSPNLISAMNWPLLQQSMCAANYLIASSDGSAYSVEVTPANVDIITDNHSGVLVHTNHLIGDKNRQQPDLTVSMMGASTYHRLHRCTQLLLTNTSASADIFKTILGDHSGGCEGICQHPSNKPGLLGTLSSVFTIMMNLNQGCASISLSNPCRGESVNVQLQDNALILLSEE